MAKPYPVVTPDTAFFWTSGQDGRLRFQRCRSCATYIHPPQPRCPECLEGEIAIVEVSGRATLATHTVNMHAWHPEFPLPYVIAIVEIVEAPYVRLTTRIVNCAPEAVRTGMALRVTFERQGPAWLPLFEPEDA